jgi:hypothetical protein
MLQALLEKLGIKNFNDLKSSEKATYQQWAIVLSKADITIDDLKKFLPKELDRAHAELRKFENSAEKDLFYKAYSELCQTIVKFIVGSTQERDQLKQYLKQKYGIE